MPEEHCLSQVESGQWVIQCPTEGKMYGLAKKPKHCPMCGEKLEEEK